MTSNFTVNLDTRVVPVQWAADTALRRDATLAEPDLAAAFQHGADNATARQGASQHQPGRTSRVQLSAPDVAVQVEERLSETVMSAQGAVGSLEARQRTYQALDRALTVGSDPANVPEAARRGTQSVAAELTLQLRAHRLRERGALSDAVQTANALGLEVAGRNAAVRQLVAARVSGPPLATAVDQRDALVRALGRLIGVSATAQADGGVDLAVGDVTILDEAGWRALSVVGQTQSTGPSGRHLSFQVGRNDGTLVPVSSGVIGGHLEVVNDVLPRALARLATLEAPAGQAQPAQGTPSTAPATGSTGPATASTGPATSSIPDQTDAPDGIAVVRASLADQVHELQRGSSEAAYLRIQGDGSVPLTRGELLEGHLGALSPMDEAHTAARLGALQSVNSRVSSMGAVAASQIGDQAASARLVVSRPDLLAAHIGSSSGEVAAADSLKVTVLSVASPSAAVSDTRFGVDQVLNDGNPFRFAVVTRAEGAEASTVVSISAFPTVKDVVSAINSSGAGVRAMTTQVAAGTVQLVLTSLATGRTSEVTITDGQQPPATSAILGRFLHLEGRDTVLKVDPADGSATVLSSSSATVFDPGSGMDLTALQAEPATDVSVTPAPAGPAVADRVEGMMRAAADVLGAVFHATQAGGPLPGDRMLGEIAGRVVSLLGVPDGAAVPGLALGRQGRLTFDRTTFDAALVGDPVATEAKAAALAQGMIDLSRDVAQPRVGYLALRLQGEQQLLPDYPAPRTASEERLTRHQSTLRDRSDALEALLGRLGAQRGWLSGQLASV